MHPSNPIVRRAKSISGMSKREWLHSYIQRDHGDKNSHLLTESRIIAATKKRNKFGGLKEAERIKGPLLN